jgi:hypothetical protein
LRCGQGCLNASYFAKLANIAPKTSEFRDIPCKTKTF